MGSLSAICLLAIQACGDSSSDKIPPPNNLTSNQAPIVSNVSINGDARAGQVLNLSYDFDDEDGEGQSLITWFTEETILQSGEQLNYLIPNELRGQKISASIQPFDQQGLSGAQVDAANNGQKILSLYEIKLQLPSCDESNPQVQIINSTDDFFRFNNSLDKTIFCVRPGNYQNITLDINRAGSADSPLYILLDNNNDTHPGILYHQAPDNYLQQLANIRIILRGASYWVIDRMALIDAPLATDSFFVMKQANDKINKQDFNIFSRVFTHNVGGTNSLRNASNNNTIQNSRFEQMSEIGRASDNPCIQLIDFNDGDPAQIYEPLVVSTNNHFVNNEFKNCSDGFQLVRQSQSGRELDYSGTIFDSNDAYITNEIYTDCAGNYTIDGQCAHAENALDIKAGATDPGNPVIISNNRFAGFRQADETSPFQGIVDNQVSDPGGAVAIHFGTKNLELTNNVVYNSAIGFSIQAKGVMDFSLQDAKITDNIFSDIQEVSLILQAVDNVEFSNNLITQFAPINDKFHSSFWLRAFDSTNASVTIKNNTIALAHHRSVQFPNSQQQNISGNRYFEASAGDISESTEELLSIDPTIDYNNLVFTLDQFTTTPKQVILTRVLAD